MYDWEFPDMSWSAVFAPSPHHPGPPAPSRPPTVRSSDLTPKIMANIRTCRPCMYSAPGCMNNLLNLKLACTWLPADSWRDIVYVLGVQPPKSDCDYGHNSFTAVLLNTIAPPAKRFYIYNE